MGPWNYSEKLGRGGFVLATAAHIAPNIFLEDWLLPTLGLNTLTTMLWLFAAGLVTLLSWQFFIVRRLHDLGRPGVMALGLILPLYQLYLLGVLALKKGRA